MTVLNLCRAAPMQQIMTTVIIVTFCSVHKFFRCVYAVLCLYFSLFSFCSAFMFRFFFFGLIHWSIANDETMKNYRTLSQNDRIILLLLDRLCTVRIFSICEHLTNLLVYSSLSYSFLNCSVFYVFFFTLLFFRKHVIITLSPFLVVVYAIECV